MPYMIMRPSPTSCPHCEYDRQFPGFEEGGWMQQDNNGPIVSCPCCNPNGDKNRAFALAELARKAPTDS